MSAMNIDRFVDSILAALKELSDSGVENPTVRRKVRTVLAECGYKAAKRELRGRLAEHFAGRGLFMEPPINAPEVGPDDFLTFGAGPFPADAVFFSKERDLQRFIQQSVGLGPLRHLRRATIEQRLPSGKRVDILCDEVVGGRRGALVAIELKREESAQQAVLQLVGYMDELRKRHPDREVRGIIMSGREDKVGLDALRRYSSDYRIDWYCYHVRIEPVSVAAGSSPA